MNLILLDTDDAEVTIPVTDSRARHVLYVLRRSPGDTFDVGIRDGKIGKARVDDISEDRVRLTVEWTGMAEPLHPLDVILGMPRPQTGRRLLRELASLGVRRLIFCDTDRSEPGYKKSRLWTTDESDRHLRAGVEQAFNPRFPDLLLVDNLDAAIDAVGFPSDRISMDNYEAPNALSAWNPSEDAVTIALGAERGWSRAERDILRAHDFSFYHLGDRVLRLETAAVACVSIVLSRMRLI